MAFFVPRDEKKGQKPYNDEPLSQEHLEGLERKLPLTEPDLDNLAQKSEENPKEPKDNRVWTGVKTREPHHYDPRPPRNYHFGPGQTSWRNWWHYRRKQND